MAYITTSELAARLGATMYARLTDRVDGETANDVVAAAIVAEAEAEADSYLAARFATPLDLTAHPELAGVLRGRVLDLAEHAAWRSSPFVSDLPARLFELRRAATAWFSAVASGSAELPASGPLGGPVVRDDAPLYEGSPRTLTHDELDGL